VVTFNFGLPFSGKGRLTDRMALSAKNIPEYNRMLKRQEDRGNLYVDVGQAMAQKFITVDLHLFSSKEQTYCDIASVHPICSSTGGDIFHYHRYDDRNHGPAMQNNLYFSLSRPTMWATKVRLRSSHGMSYSKICGNWKMEGNGSVSAGVAHQDSTITFQFVHDFTNGRKGRIDEAVGSPKVCVQMAVLYSDDHGVRKLRVCTRQFEVTPSYIKMFKGVHLPELTALVSKRAARRSLQRDLNAGRLVLAEHAINIAELYCHLICKGEPLDKDNKLPPSLTELTLDTLAMMRCSALVDVRDGNRWIDIDQRFNALFSIMHLDATHLRHYLRPTMFRVDQLFEIDDPALHDVNWEPDYLSLTKHNIHEDSIYLLDNGDKFVFRIGNEVDVLLADPFFVMDESGEYAGYLKESEDNEYVAKLRLIMDYMTLSRSPKYQSVEIMFGPSQGKACKFDRLYLILDHSNSCLSYAEFEELVRRRTVSLKRRGSVLPKDWDSPANKSRNSRVWKGENETSDK